MRKLIFIAISLSALMGVGIGLAQLGRGTIAGTIRDQQGAAVPQASVKIINTGTNVPFVTVTNELGFYTSPPLSVGAYQVTAEAPGFKNITRVGIQLQVDQRLEVNLELEIGAVTESVQVSAQAPLVDSSSAVVGKVIENKRIGELPINGRSAMALMMLMPTVKSNAGATNSGFGDRGTQISAVSINGGPTGMNNFMMDGGINNQSFIGEININPAVDAVEEFKVQTGTMSAEFGFTGGGVVNIVSKSGTNQLHGALYEFLRNDKFDARNAFDPRKAAFRYNQYGGALGGPIVRNRSFYFFNFEEWQFRRGDAPISTVPTARERAGDFSQTRQTNGNLITIFDPTTTTANPTGTGFVRSVFSGNVIPLTRMDTVARNYMEFFPLPNRTPTDAFTNAQNYTNVGARADRSMRQYLIKGDHRFSSANSLSFRYAYYRHKTGGIGLFPQEALANRDDKLENRNAVLTDIHVFSPRLINEFRASIARQHLAFITASHSADPPGRAPVDGGWPAKLGLPASIPIDNIPRVSITGLPTISGGENGVRSPVTFSAAETMTYVRSRSTVKFGIEYQKRTAHNVQRLDPSGAFTFNTSLTGNPQTPAGTGVGLATFLLGAVSNAQGATYLGQSQEGYSLSFFLQDDWKLTRKLTLNLGLRYDFQEWPWESNGGASNFNPFAQDPVSRLAGRMEYAGQGFDKTPLKPARLNLGPRVGFAYDLTGASKFIIRGGYGLYYPNTFTRDNFASNEGFAITRTNYLPPGGNTAFAAFQFKDGFPTPLIQPLGSSLGPNGFLGQTVGLDQDNARVPTSHQWNLSVQKQLPGAVLLDVTYIGNRGTHFPAGNVATSNAVGGYDYNQLDPRYLSLGLALQNQVPNPNVGIVPGALGNATITRAQSLRPYPHYDGIIVRNPHLGSFTTHSLALSLEKRLSQGLVMLVSYTGGKSINDSVNAPVNFGGVVQTNVNGFQNGKFDRRAERALDPTDVSQRAVISGSYELPFGGGRRFQSSSRVIDHIVGGWQMNVINTIQTGIPLVIRGANNNLADRPNSTGKSAKLDNPTAARWFDITQFVNPAIYTFGNVGRTLPDVRGPGTLNFDISIMKNTRLHERVTLQFRAESFNAFNKVNLNGPNTTFVPGPDGRNQSGTFGVITSAQDARVIQFGLKLLF